MELLKEELVKLTEIWRDKRNRIALQKLITNALSETDVPVKELELIWQNIDGQLQENVDKKQKGSDETV